MKWRDVTVGQVVLVKGERWEVVNRQQEGVTLKHATLGSKTGFPPPGGEVQVVPKPAERPAPEGRTLLREKREPMDERSQKIVQRERHKQQVADLNGVSVEAVEAAHVRLVLGGTAIAHLKPKELPACPEVEVMDEATMLTHLHFFHDVYPDVSELAEEDDRLRFLSITHGEHEAVTPHDHSLPF